MAQRVRRTRGLQAGPRSERVVNSVHEATLAELERVGYAQLTIDGVAKAAGVHRTTIYRRWPTRNDLIASLLEPQLLRVDAARSDTALEPALLGLAKQIAANLAAPEGRAMARVFTADDPELAELAATARNRALGAFRDAFHRAIERGEIGAGTDVEVLAHLLFFGTVLWVSQRDEPAGEADLQRLVVSVLAAVHRP